MTRYDRVFEQKSNYRETISPMSTTRPKVHIVATGGSISGIGPDRLDYLLYPELGNRLSIEEMLERIPEVETVAQVQGENLIRVGSPAIGPTEWLQLAHRINELLPPIQSLLAWWSHTAPRPWKRPRIFCT